MQFFSVNTMEKHIYIYTYIYIYEFPFFQDICIYIYTYPGGLLDWTCLSRTSSFFETHLKLP